MQKKSFVEVSRQACRWYMNNQNTDEHPWGGVRDSADKGRFIYEWFPSRNSGRGAGVWAQALGIMALHAVNLADGEDSSEYWERFEAAKRAGRYMLSLCGLSPSRKR